MVVQDKALAKNLLQRALDSIPALHQSSVDSQEFTKWRRDTRVAIENVFGQNSSQAKDFNDIKYIPMVVYQIKNDVAGRSSLYREAYINDLKKPKRYSSQ